MFVNSFSKDDTLKYGISLGIESSVVLNTLGKLHAVNLERRRWRLVFSNDHGNILCEHTRDLSRAANQGVAAPAVDGIVDTGAGGVLEGPLPPDHKVAILHPHRGIR